MSKLKTQGEGNETQVETMRVEQPIKRGENTRPGNTINQHKGSLALQYLRTCSKRVVV